MDIKALSREEYAGYSFTARYTTRGYYDLQAVPSGFAMTYVPLDAPVEKSFEDTLFGAWLEAPIAYGAFEGGRLCGLIEGSMETWNNRFRISNLCILDTGARRQGLGTRLMACMLRQARSLGARMAVLETQTCNENAIAFYRKQGFEVIGFDLYAYSNADPARHEVRLEMGKLLTAQP